MPPGRERGRLPAPLLSLRMFSDEQLAELHQATLKILADTGVRVDHPVAVELLYQAPESLQCPGTVFSCR